MKYDLAEYGALCSGLAAAIVTATVFVRFVMEGNITPRRAIAEAVCAFLLGGVAVALHSIAEQRWEVSAAKATP